jgi:UPF0716 protein FxsA
VPALLFLAFLAVPLVELWVIIQVGEVIGAWWTVLLLLVDSAVGAVIVRREGRRAWTAFRDALAAGRWPADEVAQGALVLIGGALLLTPGFVTDAMGLAFVLPPTRALLARVIRARLKQGAIRMVTFGPGGPGPGPGGPGGPGGADPRRVPPRDDAPRSGEVLDVEVVSVERDDDEPDDT